jgi:hypothetical protein
MITKGNALLRTVLTYDTRDVGNDDMRVTCTLFMEYFTLHHGVILDVVFSKKRKPAFNLIGSKALEPRPLVM